MMRKDVVFTEHLLPLFSLCLLLPLHRFHKFLGKSTCAPPQCTAQLGVAVTA